MTKEDYKDLAWDDVVEGPCVKVNSSHRPMAFSAVNTSKFTPIVVDMANNIHKKTVSEKRSKNEVAKHKQRMDGVGEIIVEVHRRTEGTLSKPAKNEITRDFDFNYEDDPIHEKARS